MSSHLTINILSLIDCVESQNIIIPSLLVWPIFMSSSFILMSVFDTFLLDVFILTYAF